MNQKPVDAWQPIETAPKRGRSLLMWFGTVREGGTIIGSWTSEGWRDDYGHGFEPSFWMPLPEQPK
jgi:hypothetical protein